MAERHLDPYRLPREHLPRRRCRLHAIFALSTLPMLIKARRSKNLMSYSFGNLLLANLGNVVHSIYVVSLPVGPIWGLHTFYLITTGLMLVWYLRYSSKRWIGRKGLRGRLIIWGEFPIGSHRGSS